MASDVRTRAAALGAGVALAVVAACVGDSSGIPVGNSSSGGSGNQPDATLSAPDSATSSSSSSSGDTDAAATSDAQVEGALDSVPGLALWLEADDLAVDTPAAIWPDRSPHHNDAAVAQTVPNVIGGNDSVNGHLAVRFGGGSGLRIADHESLQFDDAGFLIEIVERHPGITSSDDANVFEPLFEKSSGTGVRLALAYRPVSPDYRAFVQGEIGPDAGVRWPVLLPPGNPGLTRLRPHLVVFRMRSGGVLTVRGDDEAPESLVVSVPTGFGAVGVPAFLGARPAGPPLQADVAAIVVVRAADDATTARVDTYLRERFGFGPSP